MSEIETRIIKIETDLPYVKQDITELWGALSPMTRDHEELKTEIIRYLNRLDTIDKDAIALKEQVKGHGIKVVEFDEQYKFLINARKNINTIFVAIVIQTIFIVSGLLAFVFTLTQKPDTTNSGSQGTVQRARQYRNNGGKTQQYQSQPDGNGEQ